MKIIKYRLLTYLKHDDNGNEIEHQFSDVKMGWNEANEEIAKREAYNGDYTVEDDGLPDVVSVEEDIDTMLVDHELRLTMLELEM